MLGYTGLIPGTNVCRRASTPVEGTERGVVIEATAVDRSLHGNRNFLLLWAGQFVSQLGDKLALVAFPWLVYQSTHSALNTGVVLAIYTLPYVLFGVVAGVLIDRFNKRLIMIFSDLLRAALVLCVPLAANWSIAAVFVLGFLVSSIGVFFDPCRLAIVPELVSPPQLVRANSLLATADSLTEVIGLAAAGFIVYGVGTRIAFSVDSITFVVSAVALSFMVYEGRPKPETRLDGGAVRREAGEGVSFIVHNRGMLMNTIMVAAATVGLGAIYPLTFLYAVQVVGGGARTFGVLEATLAAGFLVGALALTAVADRVRKGVLMIVGMTALGACLIVIGTIDKMPLALVPFFLGGLANAVFLIAIDTYLQETVPEELRGRVSGVRFTLIQGLYAASVLIGGALAASYSVQGLFMVFGLIAVIPALAGAFVPEIRRS